MAATWTWNIEISRCKSPPIYIFSIFSSAMFLLLLSFASTQSSMRLQHALQCQCQALPWLTCLLYFCVLPWIYINLEEPSCKCLWVASRLLLTVWISHCIRSPAETSRCTTSARKRPTAEQESMVKVSRSPFYFIHLGYFFLFSYLSVLNNLVIIFLYLHYCNILKIFLSVFF